MCLGGKAPQDNSAEIARQQEAERERRIREGRSTIDGTFEQFGDPFFQERERSYLDYYTPQLEDQYEDARRKMVFSLSRSGNLNAGSGARQLGELKTSYNTHLGNLSGRAVDYTNTLRSDIENTKQELYSQNRASADPSAAASSAVARAGTLSTAPSFSPLGGMFAGAAEAGANYIKTRSHFDRDFKGPGMLFDIPKSTERTVR